MQSVLVGLAVLACPVGMGVMMWVMARGTGGSAKGEPENDEMIELRSEQERLRGEVERLENERGIPAA